MEDLKLLKPEEITQNQYILFTKENYDILMNLFNDGGWDFDSYYSTYSDGIERRQNSLYINRWNEVHAAGGSPKYDIYKGFTESKYNPDKGWEFS